MTSYIALIGFLYLLVITKGLSNIINTAQPHILEYHTPYTVNKTVYESIRMFLLSDNYGLDDFLFKSQRGSVLTVPSLSRLVKSWCKMINLKGNYASHTLRKTWGYHQRVSFNVGIPELMVCFNHSTQRQTLDYLCIQPEEIKSVYLNEL